MKKHNGVFIYFAIAACLGIAVSRSNFHWGLLSILIVYGIWFYQKKQTYRKLFPFLILTCVFFIGYMFILDKNNVTKHLEDENMIMGKVISPLRVDGDKWSFLMESSQEEKLQVEYYRQNPQESFAAFEIGLECQWLGTLKEPSPPTNPHAFHYQNYLYEQGIHWIFTLKNQPESCKSPPTKSFRMKLQSIRENAIQTILANVENPVDGFLISLVFGERYFLEKEILDSYQDLGLVHLLAISGLHVGIITVAAFYIGVRVGFTRQTVQVFLLLLLPVYVLLTGAAPSVMRAATMTGIVLLLLCLRKKVLSLDTIGVTCIVVLIISPYYLYHVGFQLSFTVCLALLLFSRKIAIVQNRVIQLFLVSFVAQVASLPLLLFHFYQISIWSPFLNVLFVPFFSVFVLPLSFLLYIVLLIQPTLLPFLLPLLSFPLQLMNLVAAYFDNLDFGTFVFGKPPFWFLSIYVVAILMFFYQWEVGKKYLGAIGFVVVLLLHFHIGLFLPTGKVIVVDIGQGDAIYISLPYNQGKYLIDTGGTFPFQTEEWKQRRKEFNSGRDVLLPFLRAEGVRKLDKLILTHGDYDHIGNVDSLWGEVDMEALVVPKGFGASDLEAEILQEASKRNVAIHEAIPDEGWERKGGSFLFLHPEREYENKNNASIVILAELGGLTWLFTGDIEEEGETDLLRHYPLLKADVLKAGHHGSKTSTNESFVNHIKPQVNIISAGRNNRFGHPHQEVLERLQQINSKIYRTDVHGAIIFEFTQENGTFSTVRP
ncbi:ComEC family competence protein [Bacillus sp. THAF10]|uniref:DNA internalization-related competence protein ComEC/Rec2 n=1 Tax=Bacillus sp. THAF10 TaxID=2587848 RepID=UPI001268F864|nr:DNA internalization-related competence protein ComEC/Rec2 [Bacillus sp. THAF10]QFT89923.1 ComEC family competence protein [Bacillus sp. THAF10]